MPVLPHRWISILVTLTWAAAPIASAQTTVVQTPGGGTQVTVQGDGSGNTLIFTQSIAVPAGGSGPQGIVGGVTFGGPGPLPPRDQQTAPASGSSRIRGRVIAADSGRPLRRATVRLVSPSAREQRSATTDQDGQYEFTQLPAAQYTIVANKSGYVQTGYRQTRANGPQRPLTLGERESLDRIDISLPPGGVVTGRVVDEFGEPVPEVMVSAQRLQFIGGARRPVSSGSPATSNDIGEFRIYGLAPGAYYLVATQRSMGNPFDINTDRTGYGQTYYPSAPDAASAQRVELRGGEVVAGLVIALAPARMARVSGSIPDADGKPLRGGAVMAMPRDGMGPPSATAPLRPDGTFVLNALPPGDYTLRSTPMGPGPGPIGMATATISVNGADISNVVLQPLTQVALSGRLTGDPAVLAQIKPASVRVLAAPSGPVLFPGPSGPPPTLREDLSFDVQAYPGSIVLRVVGLADVAVQSVRLNGRDVTRGIDLQPGGPLTDVEVEVAAATARVVVTGMNAREEPVPDRDVLIFPQDESTWGVQMPGHGGVGRTDDQGRFLSPPMLPGTYYVVDTDPLEPGESNDPELLTSLRIRARQITLGAGETSNVQLRVQ